MINHLEGIPDFPALVVPPSTLTEGLTWMVTGLGISVAMGAAVAGWVIDYFNIRVEFTVTLISALAVLLIDRLIQKSSQQRRGRIELKVNTLAGQSSDPQGWYSPMFNSNIVGTSR